MVEAIFLTIAILVIIAYYIIKWTIVGIIKLVIILKTPTQDSVNTALLDVDSMDGLSFEHYVADVLRHNGYSSVSVTKASGDFGVDVIAKKDKKKWVFQCKHYSSPLGVRPVQEVFGGKTKYNADVAVVVTNSHFTAHATELAQSLGVVLWDRNVLYKMAHKTPVPIKEKTIFGGDEMATVIGAGRYVFGEDIPNGKYNLKVVSGRGMLKIQTNGKNEEWLNLGLDDGFAKAYNGLALPQGHYFSLDGDLQVEISKSKMIEIE